MNEMLKDALNKYKNSTPDLEEIKAVFDRMTEFSLTARQYGLLALEEKVYDMIREGSGKKVGGDPYDIADSYRYHLLTGLDRLIAVLIMEVVDGMDEEYVYDDAANRYFAGNFEGSTALAACMVVEGVMAIQAGENPTMIAHRFLSMLPEDAENAMIEHILADRQEEEAAEVPESAFEALGKEDDSKLVKGLDALILGMDNRDIQTVLTKTGDYILYRCMNLISGEARKKLFGNMTAAIARATYDEMTNGYYNNFSQSDGWKLSVKWLKLIMELEEAGEIVLNGIDVGANSIQDLIEMHEQEVIARNAEINRKIKELQYELETLEKQLVEEDE